MRKLLMYFELMCNFWMMSSCNKTDCHFVFDHEEDMKCENESLTSLWDWLDGLENLKLKDIATNMSLFENTINDQNPLLNGPYSCNQQQNMVQFEGTFKKGKDGLMTGKGKVYHKSKTPRSSPNEDLCYTLDKSVTQIKGRFAKGKLQGRGTITYNDKTKMEANFHQNIVHGPVLVTNKHKTIQAVGYYLNGQAHGPFWFIYESTFVQVHFCHGELLERNVILADSDTRQVKIGTLQNGNILKNVEKLLEFEIRKYLKTISVKVPSHYSSRLEVNDHTHSPVVLELPMKIIAIPSNRRLIIRPSRIMYFNRVAKTGTFYLLHLMKSLGLHLGYDVDLGFRQDGWEKIQDEPDGLRKEVDSLVQTHRDTLKARHYAFFDVRKWGYDWAPDWFSVVRDPIERVR